MNEIEKFERHIGKATKIKLKNTKGEEDEFELVPLDVEYLPDLFAIMKAFQATTAEKEMKPEDIFKAIDEPTMQRIKKLILVMLETSYPNIETSVLKSFAMKNWLNLMNTLFEINMPTPEGAEHATLIKQKMNQIKGEKDAADTGKDKTKEV